MSIYELAILGSATEDERLRLTAELHRHIEEFDLQVGKDVLIHDAKTVRNRDKHAAFAAAYFGGAPCVDVDPTRELLEDSAPVIPTVAANADFGSQIPDFLQAANALRRRADDVNMTELAGALLECVGLLRRQRRVFVSYRRNDSRAAALQLHDLLASRGFDVFLDTHSIRPGDPFQDVLWHRLVDSDVMVMLDTPGYFESRWTRLEIGRALSKDIHVLRVIWPDHIAGKLTDMAETVYIGAAELIKSEGPLRPDVADEIVLKVERLRSRSIAARYLSITGKFRADMAKISAKVEGVGAHRAITVKLLNGRRIWAYPIVGIPTAETLYDVADKAKRSDHGMPVLVYDHVGISEAWNAHLHWLDEQIKAIRAIKVSEAGWELAGWED